ncbi:MAG TPA: DUF2142 domain-containing protein [Acidimicrobiales bacterium]|nr:DUF2142 domain-containing protein [Acidimicrobiales bacterium]
MSLVWCWSTPVPSGPDEPAQVIQAAAVVRGQVAGRTVSPSSPTTFVRVPASIAALGTTPFRCDYTPTVSGACEPRLPAQPSLVPSTTYVGHYPPLYYAVVGWPSLIDAGRLGVYGMRMVSALVGAVLLGLAVAVAAATGNRLLVLAVAAGITPDAIYLDAVVNPNGLEIAAATAAWAAALACLVVPGRPRRSLLAAFVAAEVVLAFTRPLSPGWAVGVVAVSAAVLPAPARQAWRHRSVRVALGAVGAAVVVSGAYVLLARSYLIERFPLPSGTSELTAFRMVVGAVGSWADQMVGAFGAPDTAAPWLAMAVWGGGAMALLAAVAVGFPPRARRTVIGLALLWVVVLPVAATSHDLRDASIGASWHGRYGEPLAVSVPMVAAVLARTTRPVVERLARTVPVALAVGLAGTQLYVLRRYTVGMGGGLGLVPSGPGQWQPFAPALVLAAASVVTAAGWALLLRHVDGAAGASVPGSAVPGPAALSG